LIRPLGDRVLLRSIEPITKTASGIILPEIAQEKTNRGVVVAVGNGKPSEMTGRPVPIDLEAGDEVLYSKYAGTVVESDGVEYIVVQSGDVIAVWAEGDDARVVAEATDLALGAS
jgi:chaperonin GroES